MRKKNSKRLIYAISLCVGMLSGCSGINKLGGIFIGQACELKIGKITKSYSNLNTAFNDAKQYIELGKDVNIQLNRDYVSSDLVCIPEYSLSATVSFDLNGYNLSRNHTNNKDNGEVISICNDGNIIITNSKETGMITGGKNSTNGGGIYCEIDANTNITFDNIKVSGNVSGSDGGGIYIKRTDASENTVKLKGTINVSGNTNGDLLLYNESGSYEMLDVSKLSSDSNIVIDIEGKSCYPFIDDVKKDFIDDVMNCFTTSNKDYKIEKIDDYYIRMRLAANKGASIICQGKEYYYEKIYKAWVDANNADKYLNKSIEVILNEDWIADSEKNLCNSAESIKCGFADGRLWPAERCRGNTLTLNLNGYKIDRNMGDEDRKYGNILSIEKTVDLIVKNGTLTGGHNDVDGGAIYFDAADAYVTLDGVTITGNKSDNHGGAIHCTDNTNHLTIKDCTITNNESNDEGGGIYIYLNDFKNREILLTGKVIIQHNQIKHAGSYFDSDIYFYNHDLVATASIPFPTLKEGSYITIEATRNDGQLTSNGYDDEENRASLSYFHQTPGSRNRPYIKEDKNNHWISLGLEVVY